MPLTRKTGFLFLVTLVSSCAAFGLLGMLFTHCYVIMILSWKMPKLQIILFWFFAVALLVWLIGTPMQYNKECIYRNSCMFNLKQIGEALRNYHDQYGCFPPSSVTDSKGNRVQSWRTLILPFLDKASIYQNYNFQQSWNGPTNRKLATSMPRQFRCLSEPGGDETQTSYLAVTGPNTAWPDGHSSKLCEYIDGADNSILLVEVANSGICWMEPRDITLEQATGQRKGKLQAPRSVHYQGGSYFFRDIPFAGFALFADGSVHIIPEQLSREDFVALVTINGGETVDLDHLLKIHKPFLFDSLRWDHCIGLPLFVFSLVWLWFELRRKKVSHCPNPASHDHSDGGVTPEE